MIPAFFNLGTPEILIIAFVIVLLFGAKKIPDLMHGIGKGVRSFRQGMNEVTDEIERAGDAREAAEDRNRRSAADKPRTDDTEIR